MISIIIVNYKVPDLLKKCIESLRSADGRNGFEIVVIDNASGDESKALITSAYPEVLWIQNDRNTGFASAVNAGFARTRGDIVMLLNPDTEIHPDSLSVCAEFFRSHPEAGIVGGKILNPDGSMQPQCRRRIPDPGAAFFRLFGLAGLFPKHPLSVRYELPPDDADSTREVEAVSGALMCIRRDILTELGGLDSRFFLYGEDLDICYRAAMAGHRIYYHPGIAAIHVRGASRRKLPFRTLWHIHHAMARFYSKHQARQHSIGLNFLVYVAIWCRWTGMSMAEAVLRLTGQRKAVLCIF